MKEKVYKRSERGQIIVLLALSIVVVIVVAALAVDGGMIYSERRFAQNAADASSLAAGGVILQNLAPVSGTDFCTSASSLVADAVSKAQTIAASNNVAELPYVGTFGDESEFAEDFNHGVAVVCNGTNRYIDIYVRITSSISTAFAHLIYPDALVTTNEAVTRAVPKQNLGLGNAIISLSEICNNNQDGMEFNGSSVVITIKGGGIHSNSCLGANGNKLTVTVPTGGVTLKFSEPDFSPDNGVNKPNFSTNPIGNSEIVTINYPNPPTCVDGEHFDSSTKTYSPGTYDGIQMTAKNDTWVFESGTYCMTGDLKITGGTVSGDGVTFRMINGDVDISGNPTVLLAAPYDEENEFFGLLFFMDEENEGQITLTGNNDSYFAGTVYAPTGEIIVGGTSDLSTFDSPLCALIEGLEDTCQATTFSTQLIGNYVKVSGSTEMDILFDESMNFAPDGWIYLRR